MRSFRAALISVHSMAIITVCCAETSCTEAGCREASCTEAGCTEVGWSGLLGV